MNLNWPLCCLFSSLGMTSLLPLGTSGWLGCLWGRLTHIRAGQQPPAWTLSRVDQRKRAASRWPVCLATLWKKDHMPSRGGGSHPSVPLPFHQHIQEGHSISPTSLPSQGAKFPGICQPRKKKSSNLGGGIEGNKQSNSKSFSKELNASSTAQMGPL